MIAQNRRIARRTFLKALGAGALWTALPTCGSAESVSSGFKPNVVFILADDMGYGDVESFGRDRCQIATPHLDRLASEGMRFTDAHANASVCVPTRVAVMTGRYPWRFGPPVRGGPWGFLGTRLKPGCFTLGSMMRQAGYRTGYVGKWHLGTLMQTKDGKTQGLGNVDYEKPLKIGPPQYGFDDSFILPGSLDMYPYAFVRNNRWVGRVTAKKGWSAFNRVGPAAEDFEDTKVLDTFAKQAEKFIRTNAPAAKASKPFFLYVALTAPHTPLSPSKTFENKSKIGLYGDFVMETDHCVGRVTAALKSAGLDKNTLVIATSDHGPASYAGRKRQATFNQLKELEKDGHYSSGIYRGYKFSIYEGAFRVPYVARWPGVVKPESQCDRLVALHDLAATLADIVGTKLKPDQAPDSISLLGLLRDPQSKPPRNSMILQATRAMAIRAGRWKLALCPGSGCPGGWGNSPKTLDAWKKAIADYGRKVAKREELIQAPFVQLFDLSDDPGETKNLASKHPEKVAELASLMKKQIADGRSTPGPRLKNERNNIKLFPAVPPFVWAKPTIRK
ncbi:MAG: arylsulfatase [Phycisphaerae bacterium]|jgi:arylsulfatase A-like enzyme|nr:arylsulfatase [Phycisphaerae bacterium]